MLRKTFFTKRGLLRTFTTLSILGFLIFPSSVSAFTFNSFGSGILSLFEGFKKYLVPEVSRSLGAFSNHKTPDNPKEIIIEKFKTPQTSVVATAIAAITETPVLSPEIDGITRPMLDDLDLTLALQKLLNKKEIQEKFRGPQGIPGPSGPTGAKGESGAFVSLPSNAPIPISPSFVGYVQPNPSVNFSGASLFSVTDLSSTRFNTTTANIVEMNVSGSSTLSGGLTVSGALNPSLTKGSVYFQGTNGMSEDNSNFFWDVTNHRLGLGTTTPTYKLDMKLSNDTADFLYISSDDGYMQIGNATSATDSFKPTIFGKIRDVSKSMTWSAITSAGEDTGTVAISEFRSSINNAVVVTRPLFKWTNAGNTKMTLDPVGNLTITGGLTLPSSQVEGQSSGLYEGSVGLIRTFRAVGSAGYNLFLGGAGNNTLSPSGGDQGLASLNIGAGFEALKSTTTGYNNVAIGYKSLTAVDTGNKNTAVGTKALMTTAGGLDNTAVGDSALFYLGLGVNNTAIGSASMYNSTTANDNVAVGVNSLLSNTDGDSSVAVGYSALRAATTANMNTAIGYKSQFSNQTGSFNVAMGGNTLYSNLTGVSNLALGVGSLYLNTAGSYNVSAGDNSMYNTTGSENTGLGVDTLFANTTGSYNTAVGKGSLRFNVTGNSNVAIGYKAGFYETGSNKLFIDNAQRGSEADGRAKALVYGVFDADPANQILTVNGKVGVGTTAPSSTFEVAGTLGSSVVTNGTFTSDLSSWSGTNWAWNAGTAKHTTGNTTALSQAGATVALATQYKLTFSIVGRNAGDVTPSVGGATFAATSDASNALYFYSTATTALSFTPSSTFDGAIDDVTLIPITNGTQKIAGRTTLMGKTMIGTDVPTIADDYMLYLFTRAPGSNDVLRLTAPDQASIAFTPYQTSNSAHILGYAAPGVNTGLSFITHDLTRMTINPEGPIGINYSPVSDVFAVGGKSGVITQRITGYNASGQSLGLGIDSGTSSSDWGLRIRNVTGASSYFIVNGVGNVGIGTTSLAAKLEILDTSLSGSGSLAGSALSIAQTWSTSGTPTAIKLNVTDSSSNVASLLLDLQVGSATKASINKAGEMGLSGASPLAGYSINAANNINLTAAKNISWGAGNIRIAESSNAMIFSTYTGAALTEKMRINGAGLISLGGTTSSFPAIKRNATAINFRLADDSADAPITSAGLTLSANPATDAGDVFLCISAGGVVRQGATCSASAERFKDNITSLAHGLDWLTQFTPSTYIWKYNGSNGMSLIADNLANISPELAIYQGGQIYSINDRAVQAVVVKSIQEMNLKINEINNFEKENDWRDSLIAWLGNAGNRITRIFTGEICLASTGEETVCLNREELQSLKGLLNQPPSSSSSVPVSSAGEVSTPEGVETPTPEGVGAEPVTADGEALPEEEGAPEIISESQEEADQPLPETSSQGVGGEGAESTSNPNLEVAPEVKN